MSSSSSDEHKISLLAPFRPEQQEENETLPDTLYRLLRIPKTDANLAQDSASKYNHHVQMIKKKMNQLLDSREQEREHLMTDGTIPEVEIRQVLLTHILKAENAKVLAMQDLTAYSNRILKVEEELFRLCQYAKTELAKQLIQLDQFLPVVNKLHDLREKGVIMNIGYGLPENRINQLLGSENDMTAVIIPLETKERVYAHIVFSYHEKDIGKRFNIGGGGDQEWDWYEIITDKLRRDINNHGKGGRDMTDWRTVSLYYKYHGDELPECPVLKQQLNPLWSFTEIAYNRHKTEKDILQRNKEAHEQAMIKASQQETERLQGKDKTKTK
jgi:hypothetical protein